MRSLLRALLFWPLIAVASHPKNVDDFSSSAGECSDACVAILESAKDSICIQAVRHMPSGFERALMAAAKRGVKVDAILDEPQPLEAGSGMQRVAPKNVPVIIVVDEISVVTGLLNVSKSVPDQQLEGLLVIRDKNLAQSYLEELRKKMRSPKKPEA